MLDLKTRLDNLFTSFDHDKNGKLELSDFVLQGKGVAKSRGYEENSEQEAKFVQGFVYLFEILKRAMDTNNDNVISYDEWHDAFKNLNDKNSQWVREVSDKFFQSRDVNGNGEISVDEWFSAASKLNQNLKREEVQVFFDNISGGKGITKDTYYEGVIKPFFTTNELPNWFYNVMTLSRISTKAFVA